jgi:hypothetical protein
MEETKEGVAYDENKGLELKIVRTKDAQAAATRDNK